MSNLDLCFERLLLGFVRRIPELELVKKRALLQLHVFLQHLHHRLLFHRLLRIPALVLTVADAADYGRGTLATTSPRDRWPRDGEWPPCFLRPEKADRLTTSESILLGPRST